MCPAAQEADDGGPLVVVMGVSGVGKTTVGELLAGRLGVSFADADEFHPPANIAKMSDGIPLVDDDRWPWLDAIGSWLADRAASGAVVTCSALKRSYRDAIRAQAPTTCFLYLEGDAELIRQRMTHRPHHFMPASLLDSQLATLEPPDEHERAVVESASEPPDEIVDNFLRALSSPTGGTRD
ncbi:MAG: gluconokinase [Nocardioidaceae bacterium]